MPELEILPHVRPADREAAARIYCEALVQKLRPFFGTADAAAGFLSPHLSPDRAVTARLDGRLVGIAGYRLDGRGLFEPRFRDLRDRFGLVGASWRALGLSLLEKTPDADTLAMDGIAVDARARGAGVGTALLDAIVAVARRAGLARVRLEVIDTNPRARALYERFGFVAGQTRDLAILQPLFGFRGATGMTCAVDRPRAPGPERAT